MCTVCTHPHGGPILEPGVPDPVEAAPEAAVLLPCTTRVHCKLRHSRRSEQATEKS
jgi:hypothetical protein